MVFKWYSVEVAFILSWRNLTFQEKAYKPGEREENGHYYNAKKSPSLFRDQFKNFARLVAILDYIDRYNYNSVYFSL
jgi:hypothetical protein